MPMQQFKNILFVTNGLDDDGKTLKQAMMLAHDNGGKITVWVNYPGLRPAMQPYRISYEQSLQDAIGKSIATAEAAMHERGKTKKVEPKIVIESGDAPTARIVQRVLREKHDIVMKAAATPEQGKGFEAMEMELLRACPCPVWLWRPRKGTRDLDNIAVAIDPHTDNPAAQKLSVRLLELAEALAGYAEAKIHVISCWEFEYENFLRDSAFAHASEAEIQQSLQTEESNHLQALKKLVAEAKVGVHTLHHVRGKPEKTIAGIVEKIGADVVVMGTVARTGVSGFFIGNTAENVLRQLSCSLIALKPENFVSPIKD